MPFTLLLKLWNSKARPVIVLLVTLLLGVGIGRFSGQTTTTTNTQSTQTSQTVDKTNKETASTSDVNETKTDRRQTHTIITKKPDGTVTTEIFDLDTGTVFVDNRKGTTTDTQTTDTANSSSTSKTSTTTNPPPKWHLDAMAGLDARAAISGKPTMVYGGSVDYRVLGPVSVGGFGLSTGTVGVEIGLGF